MRRKREIQLLADKYYKEYEVLRSMSPEVFKRAILDMYLNTDLTISDIEDKIKEIVKRKSNKVELKYKEDGDSYLVVNRKETIYMIIVLTALLISLITIVTILIR